MVIVVMVVMVIEAVDVVLKGTVQGSVSCEC